MNRAALTMQVLQVGLAVVCCGCSRSSSYEVGHVLCPNGSLEATLAETNGGATTSFGYEVSVGLKGIGKDTRVASLYGAIRSEQAYGVNLRWANNNVLQIEYLRAKSVSNVLNAIDVNGQQVRVILESGVEDPQAPSRGMLFNLQKRFH